MALDFSTILLMATVTSFVSAIALYFLYRLLPEIPGLKQAAIAGASQAIASIFLLARDAVDPALSILVSNAAYFLAYAFYYQAVRMLCDRDMEWRGPMAIFAMLYPLIILFMGNENMGERIIVSSIGIGGLTLMSGWVLWRGETQLSRRGLAIIFAVATLLCGIRILFILAQPSMNYPNFNRASMIFILGIVVNIAIMIGVIVITTERLREQLRLQLREVIAAHDIARTALRDQKNFMAMLSHEFKTPLSIIKANADAVTIIDNPPAPFIKESMERIQQTSLRLSNLVDGCLSDERISTVIEKNELSMASLNLVELLTGLSREYGVRFVNKCSSVAAPMQGDRYLVPILFSSLIDNARKHASCLDNIEVRLLCAPQNRTVPITVEIFDDGQGVAEQDYERIFDKYYRVQPEKQQHGSGLGLFFVRRIAEQHGGMVRVACRQGTTFTVTLPACGSY